MKVTAEIQVIPIGVGVSVRAHVERAVAILRATGLKLQNHAEGTNVEGELDDVLAAIKRLHEELHAAGVPRISSHIKIGSRTDKAPSLEGKRLRSAADDWV